MITAESGSWSQVAGLTTIDSKDRGRASNALKRREKTLWKPVNEGYRREGNTKARRQSRWDQWSVVTGEEDEVQWISQSTRRGRRIESSQLKEGSKRGFESTYFMPPEIQNLRIILCGLYFLTCKFYFCTWRNGQVGETKTEYVVGARPCTMPWHWLSHPKKDWKIVWLSLERYKETEYSIVFLFVYYLRIKARLESL